MISHFVTRWCQNATLLPQLPVFPFPYPEGIESSSPGLRVGRATPGDQHNIHTNSERVASIPHAE